MSLPYTGEIQCQRQTGERNENSIDLSNRRDVLGLAQEGEGDNFIELGGDSILSIQIVSRAKTEGILFTAQQLFENQTIAELARVAQEMHVDRIDQGTVTGPCLLTPAQAWMFDNGSPAPHHFNQSFLLQVPAELDAEALSDAGGLDAEIEANQDALEAAGHWGVPTLVFEGEPFFGQDRFDMAKWRMEQKGLTKR